MKLFTLKRFLIASAAAAGLWLLAAGLCLGLGSDPERGMTFGYNVGWTILETRLMRVLTASLVGAALAAAGVAFQAMLRNPLASPYILGVSSGASLGVIVSIFIGQFWAWGALTGWPQPLISLIFAGGTILLVYLLAQRRGRLDPWSLLLTGVIVNAFNGALIMFLHSRLRHGMMADMALWLMGIINENVLPVHLALGGAMLAVGMVILMLQAKSFNLLAMGEETAAAAGVRVNVSRMITFIVGSLLTAAAVAVSGPIGFVGLICPHLMRMAFGPDHRLLLPMATAFGAVFLLAADTLARTTIFTFSGELPVGVITALTGGPFFIYLLRTGQHTGKLKE